MTKSRCECGKVKSKYMNECNDCAKAMHEKRIAEAKAIVATGKCPTCGNGLKRNLSLSGWIQCEQLGAESFRKYPDQPSCNFQTFTD